MNGFSFLAVIIAYASCASEDLHSPPVMARPKSVGEVRSSLAEGLRYVRRTEIVLLATVTVGVASTFGFNFGVMIPTLADQVLHTDATGYGFLMTATGVGSLIAALAIAFSGRSRPLIVPLGAIVLGGGLAAAALVPGFGARARGDAVRRARRDRHGRDRQHDDPACRARRAPRTGDQRLHDGVRGLDAARRRS